jgi:hypothetical protein
MQCIWLIYIWLGVSRVTALELQILLRPVPSIRGLCGPLIFVYSFFMQKVYALLY